MKEVVYCELVQGKSPQWNPYKRFKDNLKGIIKKVIGYINSREDLASGREISVGFEEI